MGRGFRIDAENPVALGRVLPAAIVAQIVHDGCVLEGPLAGRERLDQLGRAAHGARLARSVLHAIDMRLLALVLEQDEAAIGEVAADEFCFVRMPLPNMNERHRRARPFVAAIRLAQLLLSETEGERFHGEADEALKVGPIAHGVRLKERTRLVGEPVRARLVADERPVRDIRRTVDHPGMGTGVSKGVFIGLFGAGIGERFKDAEHGCEATPHTRTEK